ncbi:GAF domain-containing protein [Methanogenium organophilum]|uniref:GAF domain-containing protein n=1 Tax=Methanogenium organophilum TaxID=2199 RepID=A0A9X9S6D0_METOG|nr:GAF domain-containing protein [Methanogenium organophilum]WAI01715.1 GAF domain-containing protein [Methanogenium organophilum]
MAPIAGLSDTEKLIISYIQSHPPEECMLDKISMGIGKSRATVLKYLGMLHAKEILDFRHIGRNKLWMLKHSPEPEQDTGFTSDADSLTREVHMLASMAFELNDVALRETQLKDKLNHPELIVLSVDDNLRIIFKNNLFLSRFPDTVTLGEIIRPDNTVKIAGVMRGTKTGSFHSIELDLMEKAGIYRPYQFSFFPHPSGVQTGCTVIVGEDLSVRKQSRRHLEALLYIIRAAGNAKDEMHLLKEAMTGVREKLLPYAHCAVFLSDMRTAYSTFAVTDEMKTGILPFITRCMTTLESVSAGEGDRVLGLLAAGTGTAPVKCAVALPIIEEENAVGAILLVLESDVSTTEIENVEIVADEISGALKMQRLDRERAEYVNTLLAMNRISTILNDTRDESSILEKSIESAMVSLGFEMGCVYLKDDKDEMTARVHRNMPENLRNMCISGMFDGLFERAFTERNLIYITSEMTEYAMLDPAMRANGLSTLLILPIKTGGRVVGLLNMGSRDVKHYLETSLVNISSIGLQLGVALERARLARALESRSENGD